MDKQSQSYVDYKSRSGFRKLIYKLTREDISYQNPEEIINIIKNIEKTKLKLESLNTQLYKIAPNLTPNTITYLW